MQPVPYMVRVHLQDAVTAASETPSPMSPSMMSSSGMAHPHTAQSTALCSTGVPPPIPRPLTTSSSPGIWLAARTAARHAALRDSAPVSVSVTLFTKLEGKGVGGGAGYVVGVAMGLGVAGVGGLGGQGVCVPTMLRMGRPRQRNVQSAHGLDQSHVCVGRRAAGWAAPVGQARAEGHIDTAVGANPWGGPTCCGIRAMMCMRQEDIHSRAYHNMTHAWLGPISHSSAALRAAGRNTICPPAVPRCGAARLPVRPAPLSPR